MKTELYCLFDPNSIPAPNTTSETKEDCLRHYMQEKHSSEAMIAGMQNKEIPPYSAEWAQAEWNKYRDAGWSIKKLVVAEDVRSVLDDTLTTMEASGNENITAVSVMEILDVVGM